MMVASSFLKPLLDNPLKELIVLSVMLLPILSLLVIIGFDSSIGKPKRIIAILVFVFLLTVTILASVIELVQYFVR